MWDRQGLRGWVYIRIVRGPSLHMIGRTDRPTCGLRGDIERGTPTGMLIDGEGEAKERSTR